MFCILYALTAIPIFGFVNIRVANLLKGRYNWAKVSSLLIDNGYSRVKTLALASRLRSSPIEMAE